MSKKPTSSSSTRGGRGARGGRHGSAPAPAAPAPAPAAGSKGSPGSTTSSLIIDPDPPLALGSSMVAAAAIPSSIVMAPPLPSAASYPPLLANVLGGGSAGQGGGGQSGTGAGGNVESPLETLFSAARQLNKRAGPQAAAGGIMAPYPGLGVALGVGGGGGGGGAQGGELNALQQLLALQQQGAGGLGGMIGAGATAAAAAAAGRSSSSSSSSSSCGGSGGSNDRAALGALLDAAERMDEAMGAGSISSNNKRPFDVAMGGSTSSSSGPAAAAATTASAAAAAPGAFVPPNLGLPAPVRPFPAHAPPGAAAFPSISVGGGWGRPPMGSSSISGGGGLARHVPVPAPGATAGSFRFPSSMLPSGTFHPHTPPGPPPPTNLAFPSLVGSISDAGSGGSGSGVGGGWPTNISSIIHPQHGPAQQHAGTGTSPPSVPTVAPVIPIMGAPLGLGLPPHHSTSLGKAVAGASGLGLLASASSASPSCVRSGRSEEGSGGGGCGGGGRRHCDSDLDDDDGSDDDDEEESDEEEEEELEEERKPRLGRGMRARHARRRATSQRGEGSVGGGGDDESKVERRKERARMYSSVARKKQETSMKDLKLEMECLTVYRLMIDECPDMVAVLSSDSEGRLLFANAAFTALLRGVGMGEAAEQQQAVWPLFHESHRAELLNAARAVMAEGNDAGGARHIRLRLRTSLPAGEEGEAGGGEYELSLRYSQTGIVVYMRPNEGPADGVGGWEGVGAGKEAAAAGQAKSPA